MEEIALAIFGIVAGTVVSHYYYRKSTLKQLSVYKWLSARIFSGIDPDVRHQLHFTFRGEEVDDLHQLEFLVANDGERAISNIIEPLTMHLPPGIRVLDASIIYRQPNEFAAEIEVFAEPKTPPAIRLIFPLMNKGEFIFVKLLLGGALRSKDVEFRLLADDLPRSLKFKHLPESANVRDSWFDPFQFIFGSIIAWLSAIPGYVVYAFWKAQPDISPYPWSSFRFSPASIAALLMGLIAVIMAALGLTMVVSSLLGGALSRVPHFKLPTELRMRQHGLLVNFDPEDLDFHLSNREEDRSANTLKPGTGHRGPEE